MPYVFSAYIIRMIWGVKNVFDVCLMVHPGALLPAVSIWKSIAPTE